MPVTRRELLGLGLAAAISVGASACRGAGEGATKTSDHPKPTIRPSPTLRTVSREPSFAGCPPAGNLYYGASLPYGRPLQAWEQTLGSTLSLNRSYFTPAPDVAVAMATRCRDDLAHDRLPHVSIKPTGTWSDTAAGVHDEWLTELLRLLGQDEGPIFFTLHHEPENDAGGPGMQPSDYVAMQAHTISLAGDLAPRVTVVPVLQHWTFDPLHYGVDPSQWIVGDAAVLGLDVYNAWTPTNGKPWLSFGSRVDEVAAWFGDKPLAIGEYGTQDDPGNPGIASEWLREAAEYAQGHNIVSMSYFNSGVNAADGSYELTGDMEQTFAELLASPWVARPG